MADIIRDPFESFWINIELSCVLSANMTKISSSQALLGMDHLVLKTSEDPSIHHIKLAIQMHNENQIDI